MKLRLDHAKTKTDINNKLQTSLNPSSCKMNWLKVVWQVHVSMSMFHHKHVLWTKFTLYKAVIQMIISLNGWLNSGVQFGFMQRSWSPHVIFSSQNLPVKLRFSICEAHELHSFGSGPPVFRYSSSWKWRCAKVSKLHLIFINDAYAVL